MANHKNAKKAIRQTERRTGVNRSRMTRMRTCVKSAEKALGMHTAPAVSFDEAKVAVPPVALLEAVGGFLSALVSKKVSLLLLTSLYPRNKFFC